MYIHDNGDRSSHLHNAKARAVELHEKHMRSVSFNNSRCRYALHSVDVGFIRTTYGKPHLTAVVPVPQ